MSARTTLADVARAAGVGVATVDRVLNKRAPVARATAERVVAAAEALGYHGTTLLRRRLDEIVETKTLGFLLQGRNDRFYQPMAAAFAEATRALTAVRGRPLVDFNDDLAPPAVAAKLMALGERADVVALVAADHPKVAAAVEALAARGVPVVTLLAELSTPAVAGHVGIDPNKAGRTAAWAIARLARTPGPVGILVGSHRYTNHERAEMSFRSYFREKAPQFRLLESLANLEDSRLSHEATLELLKRAPDLVGIYDAGGGMEGLIAALRERGGGAPIVAVCNELIPATRLALEDGVLDAVIGTPVGRLVETALRLMLGALAGEEPARVFLPFDLFVAENV
ncbi:LacI family DNA-binding transcriptional regulator [Prosthecomicrobium pneumaticum]|uniref:LacI family transcriptional regulator n=1 Tax=Prosthecomicrobium pneumaticum TaxID=81895 RepID=A0A7W9CUY2_9HYPH|nr:LacI family DNA-binding transcriptional regulator [Prosthecomicrobium pneumaticum]MBB5751817.1 LacI family transcriptional regulator [Prosthecomicrobium pneumaticum]